MSGINASFLQHVKTSFGVEPEGASLIVSLYDIKMDDEDEVAFSKIENFVNDVMFYAPNILTARGWKDRNPACVIHVNVTDAWNDAYVKNGTPHTFELAMLFQNLCQEMDATTAASAKVFAADIIKFINGADSYPSFSNSQDSETVIIYDEVNSPKILPKGDVTERRSAIFELIDKVDLEQLVNIVLTFVFPS